MKIAILGGAFDPPHLGHYELAKEVLKAELADQIWYMPAGYHVYDKKMAPTLDRLYMCWLNRALDQRNVEVSPYEMAQRLDGATWSLMNALMVDPYFRHHEFSYIIGLDNANTIVQWVNYQMLLDKVPFIVVPRQGEEINSGVDWYRKGHHRFLDVKVPSISSTEIRWGIKKQESEWKSLVHPAVYHYITEHKLYQV